MKFPSYLQPDTMDCGPTCLRMVAKHYGKSMTLSQIRLLANISREGLSLYQLSQTAEKLGFKTVAIRTSLEKLAAKAPLPCIIFWENKHFVVVYRIGRKRVWIADPARGLISYPIREFCQFWLNDEKKSADHSVDLSPDHTLPDRSRMGYALLLEPTPSFYENPSNYQNPSDWSGSNSTKLGFARLTRYLLSYKSLLIQLILTLLTGSLLQFIIPFVTQSIVDVGIRNRNLDFVYLVLGGQLMLFAGRLGIEFIRGWLMLHISTRVNISILSDFFIKLMRLPLSFFDVKMYGDIIQRIGDHHRIEQFLTGQSLSTLFSLLNLIVFGTVLALYHLPIFAIYLVSNLVYAAWVVLFLNQRKKLDIQQFSVSSKEQSAMIELITGMQEIKLAGAQVKKRWQWEELQARLFGISLKGVSLNQYQQAGAFVLTEGTTILITFLAAKAVIDGQLTLGAMLAMQYILGQLSSPVEQFIQLAQAWQDARLSLDRLNEIHSMADEDSLQTLTANHTLTGSKSLMLTNVCFTYPGGSQPTLLNITCHIPEGKTTAIVGTSGSGKTTFLKLLLKFYLPQSGQIKAGSTNLEFVSHQLWRSNCGVVMQDGFLFSDSIAENIALGEEKINIERLLQSVEIANIREFIESLPLGYQTRIGPEGVGLSQGQKQRILIARAVYKNPHYLFFDEATNALDTSNERKIITNLQSFFTNRTVVIVAHRLSTVKNADQIIVIDKGEIVQVGTHSELVSTQGHYYTLVKDQLELSEYVS